MIELSIMIGDSWEVNDYCYIIDSSDESLDGVKRSKKKKLTSQDVINLKLGISFEIVCPNAQLYEKAIYKIIQMDEYKLYCEETLI